jgi:hypothetical protein
MIVKFGEYKIQTRVDNQTKYIYDIVRKKWIVSAPEEEVRQLWLHYLHFDKGFSLSKIAVEKGFHINDRLKRFDICVFDEMTKPHILIECKAPHQKITTSTMEQLARYNIHLDAKIFILTNGLNHYGYSIEKNNGIELDTF